MNVTCGHAHSSSISQTPTPLYHQPSSNTFQSYVNNKQSSQSVTLSSFSSVMDAESFSFSFRSTHHRHLHNSCSINNNHLVFPLVQKSPIPISPKPSHHHHHDKSGSGSLLLPDIKCPTPLSQLSLSFTILLIVIQDLPCCDDGKDVAREHVDSQSSSFQQHYKYTQHVQLLDVIIEKQKSLRQLGVLPVLVFSDKSSEEECFINRSQSHMFRIVDEQYELTRQLIDLVLEEEVHSNCVSMNSNHEPQQQHQQQHASTPSQQFLHPQQTAQLNHHSTTPRKGHPQPSSHKHISEFPNTTTHSMMNNTCHNNVGRESHSKLLPKLFLIRDGKLVFHWDESTMMDKNDVIGNVLSTIVLKLPQCTMSTEDITLSDENETKGVIINNGSNLNSKSSNVSSEKISPSNVSSSSNHQQNYIVVPTGMSLQDAFGVLTGRCSARSHSNGSASGGGEENHFLGAVQVEEPFATLDYNMGKSIHSPHHQLLMQENCRDHNSFEQTENAADSTNPVSISQFVSEMFDTRDDEHQPIEKSSSVKKHHAPLSSNLSSSIGTTSRHTCQTTVLESSSPSIQLQFSHNHENNKYNSNASILPSPASVHDTPLLGNSTKIDKNFQQNHLSTSSLSVALVDSNTSSSTLISGNHATDMSTSQHHCIPNTSSLSLNTETLTSSSKANTPPTTNISAEILMQRKRFSLFRKLREKFQVEKIELEQQRLEREMQLLKSEKKKKNHSEMKVRESPSKRSIFALCFGFSKEVIDDETSPLSRPSVEKSAAKGNVYLDSYEQSISEMYQIMHDDMKRQYFKLYSLKQFNAENLLFYEDVKLFYKKIVLELKKPYMTLFTSSKNTSIQKNDLIHDTSSSSNRQSSSTTTATTNTTKVTHSISLLDSTSTAPSSTRKSKFPSIGFASKRSQAPSAGGSSPSSHSKSLSSTSIIETKSRFGRQASPSSSLETAASHQSFAFTLPKNSELVQDLYEKIFRMAEYIALKYLFDPESVYCLNTSNKLVEQVKQKMKLPCWDFIDQADHLFDEVVSELVKSVLPDMFFRFVLSTEYMEMQEQTLPFELFSSESSKPSSQASNNIHETAQHISLLRSNISNYHLLSKLNLSGLQQPWNHPTIITQHQRLSEEFNNNLAANCYYSPLGRISSEIRPGYFHSSNSHQ